MKLTLSAFIAWNIECIGFIEIFPRYKKCNIILQSFESWFDFNLIIIVSYWLNLISSRVREVHTTNDELPIYFIEFIDISRDYSEQWRTGLPIIHRSNSYWFSRQPQRFLNTLKRAKGGMIYRRPFVFSTPANSPQTYRLNMLVKGGEHVTHSSDDYAVTQFHVRLISDVINSKRAKRFELRASTIPVLRNIPRSGDEAEKGGFFPSHLSS